MNDRRVLIFGADGLRPDQIRADLMPNLHMLASSGVRFGDHHSVYPSHTRVNASTFSTGCAPGRHGIVANTFIAPNVTDDHIIETGNYQHLDLLDQHSGAQLVASLSDVMSTKSARVAVAGNGSSGSNVLWTFGDRSRMVNPGSAFGIADLYDLREKLGPIPEFAVPAIAACRYATRAVTDLFLHEPDCKVITLWLAEPDTSLHHAGLGSPEVVAALLAVDECLGNVLETMIRMGIRDQFDVLFLSDHGHSTVRAHKTLRDYLIEARNALGSIPPLVTASDYIYATPGEAEPAAAELEPLVEWLRAQSWCDVIAAGPDSLTSLDGVIPLRWLWNGSLNDRRPLLAVSPKWSADLNEFGVPGVVESLTTQSALRSSHGSLSPYDMHCTWIASGPSFRQGVVSDIPTGNVDILPTVLSLLDLAIPVGVDGRIAYEALRADAAAPEVVDERAGSVLVHRVGTTTYVHGSESGGEFRPVVPFA